MTLVLRVAARRRAGLCFVRQLARPTSAAAAAVCVVRLSSLPTMTPHRCESLLHPEEEEAPFDEKEVMIPWPVVSALRRWCAWALWLGPLVVWAPLGLWLFEDAWWRHARWALERCGTVWTKLGQWAACRPDLFPRAACARLARLQHSARAHAWSETAKSMAAAVGDDWRVLYELDEEPVGSGVVAQVHRGVDVKNGGRAVAVKVVHPDARRRTRGDLDALRLAALLVRKTLPTVADWYDPEGAVAEFSAMMTLSTSMRSEVRFLSTARRLGSCRAPEPLFARDCADASVLVETFEEGLLLNAAIDEIEKTSSSDQENRAKRQLADRGLKCLLRMLFVDNFAHADMHAGNVLVRAHGEDFASSVAAGDFDLILLDFGLVVQLQRSDRRNFLDLFRAVVTGDGKGAGTLLLERAKKQRCDDPDKFASAVEALVHRATSGCEGLTLRNLDVASLVADVLALCYQHRVRLDTTFTNVCLAVAIVEGIGRRLDPDLDLLHTATPFVFQALLGMQKTPTPRMASSS